MKKTVSFLMAIALTFSLITTNVSLKVFATSDLNSVVTNINIPDTMIEGETINVSITMLNSGLWAWDNVNPYRLGASGSNNIIWGGADYSNGVTDQRILVKTSLVPTNDSYTFDFSITAPNNPTTITVAAQMVLDGYAWFGEIMTKNITVLNDPKAFYVDNTNGNDSNDGLTTSTPWKTLSKVSGTTFYNGDTINLKCGEVWNESLTLNGQGTLYSPITVQSYGTGNKPKIRSNAGTVVGGTNNGGWTIKGLAIECTSTDTINIGVQNTGVQFTYDGTGTYANVNILDNEIFGTGGIDRNTQAVRIITLSNNDAQGRVLDNITVNNNLIHDIGWLGIATTGWNMNAGRDLLSRQLYGNVNVQRNTIYNTACQGITIHSLQGGTIKWNLVYNCGQYTGTAVSWGTSGIWCMLASDVVIKFNEVYGQSEAAITNYDASGFDIDWTCENISLQYNYSHDNKGPGIETMSNLNCNISYNKVASNTGLSNIGNGQITLSSFTGDPTAMTGLTNLSVYKNIILVNKVNTVALYTNPNFGGTWSGNSFTYNNIVYSNLLTGTKVDVINSGAPMTTVNYNNIYSSTGTAFKGSRNGINYTTLSAWRTGTGFDINSATAKYETTVPTALLNLNGSQGTGLVVNLTWTASTDSGRGISHYNIHRSTVSGFTPAYNNMVGESTSTSFSDSDGLSAGVTYYYKVTAEDKCGNVGTAGSKTIVVS